jgi:hypothetical protein
MNGRKECVRILLQHGASSVCATFDAFLAFARRSDHIMSFERCRCSDSLVQVILDHCGLSPLTVAISDEIATMCP